MDTSTATTHVEHIEFVRGCAVYDGCGNHLFVVPWPALRMIDLGNGARDVPGAFPSHRLGKPSRRWVYRNALGRRHFVVAPFDKANGEKEILPLTYCEILWLS